MNVFDTVQEAFDEVDPLPLAQRRMIREQLFGAGANDATRTINARSESGAVVSTAPHGFRIPVQKRHPGRGLSALKAAAGLAVLGVVGFFAWSSFSGTDIDGEAATTTAQATTTAAPTTSIAPVVDTPLERTGVSRAQPLVLPPTLLAANELLIAPANGGVSDVLLRAPDGSTLWIGEFDGPAASLDEFNVRAAGAINVAAIEQPASVSYRFDVPCGVVLMNDAPGQAPFRPDIESLLNSMSIDSSSTIDVTLPNGWSVLDIGSSQPSYITEFQLPLFDDVALVRLNQIPNGSISQLAFGGRQLAPITFLGGPAFINSSPNIPELVSVFWRDDDTVFNVSSSSLGLADLELFVATLEPATASEWSTRFDLAIPNPASGGALCSPQPSFGSTLNP